MTYICTDMDELSTRQRQILDLLSQSQESGKTPTIREVADHLGIAPSTSQMHFERMEKKGYIRRGSGARNIDILYQSKRKNNGRKIPILGNVSAGRPILAIENVEGHVHIDSSFTGSSGEFFGLRVQGNSMNGAGIIDGDIVVVRKQDHSDVGAIVVALLEEEVVTVKRLQKDRDALFLNPENPAYEPIRCNENTRVIGQVVTLIRKIRQ